MVQDKDDEGWGGIPGMWGVKQRMVGLEWSDVTRIVSESPAGTIHPVIATGSESGKDILVLAIVLGEKSFKRAKKAVTGGGGLFINLYIDDLAHPDLGCVIPVVLVEIAGFSGTARGFIDVADIAANGKLLGLEEAAKRGTVDFLLVDARGRSLHITGISSPVAPAVARVTDGIMGAVDAYRERPWSIETVEQAFIDLDHMLDSYDVRSIDDHKEVRRMAEEEDVKEDDIEFEA